MFGAFRTFVVRFSQNGVVRLVLIFALVGVLAADLLFPPPLPSSLSANGGALAQVVLARDGTPLRAFPDRANLWRHPVRLEEVSPRYVEAVLAYEDTWFRWHPGVNPVALLRAAGQWVWHGRIVSGGSTLTMQTARLLEEAPTGDWRAKLRQIRLDRRAHRHHFRSFPRRDLAHLLQQRIAGEPILGDVGDVQHRLAGQQE